ncbi:polyprotein [Phanerochaete sordida]|uniref:Polyprotein n=1 Tax=Phanerochaete sordida TaxID=48140 RepID=A0A9P3GXZ8_9APHY|nr:polyprotein [Phanerochaete sordida]
MPGSTPGPSQKVPGAYKWRDYNENAQQPGATSRNEHVPQTPRSPAERATEEVESTLNNDPPTPARSVAHSHNPFGNSPPAELEPSDSASQQGRHGHYTYSSASHQRPSGARRPVLQASQLSARDVLVDAVLADEEPIPEHIAQTTVGLLIREYLKPREQGTTIPDMIQAIMDSPLRDETIQRTRIQSLGRESLVYSLAISDQTLFRRLAKMLDGILLDLAAAVGRPQDVYQVDVRGIWSTLFTASQTPEPYFGRGGDDSPPSSSSDDSRATNPRCPACTPRTQSLPPALTPRIEPKLRMDDLPSWDSDDDTAIDYFMQIHELASLGGSLPEQLGMFLWKKFSKGSEVEGWWLTLNDNTKAYMREHYEQFIEVIRDKWLGKEWAFKQKQMYAEMRFRQKGHGAETPLAFTRRRLASARMLDMIPRDRDGRYKPKKEIEDALQVFPIAWTTMLENLVIRDAADLQHTVKRLSKELLHLWERDREGDDALSEKRVLAILERNGISTSRELKRKFFPRNGSSRRTVLQATIAEEEEPVSDEDTSALSPPLVEAYAAIQASNRNTPLEPVGRKKHWDKECPHYEQHRALREAKLVGVEVPSISDRDPEVQAMYNHVYEVLRNEHTASLYVDASVPKVVPLRVPRFPVNDEPSPRSAAVSKGPKVKNVYSVRVEDLDDEEGMLPTQRSIPLEDGILLDDGRDPPGSASGREREVHAGGVTPPSPADIVDVPSARQFAPGQSAKGISVLSVRGHIGRLEEPTTDLRFDSCADVTLISDELYQSLKHPPKLRQGAKMNLWQLVDKKTSIEGYIALSVYVPTEQGVIARLRAEAYVIKGMTVPLLLGEDFQRTFEIGVRRDVREGSFLLLGKSGLEARATDVAAKVGAPSVRKSVAGESSFVRAKATRRAAHDRRRRRLEALRIESEVRTAEDVILAPGTVRNVSVRMHDADDREWLVERALIHSHAQAYLAVPNCLVNGAALKVPLSNPTDSPLKVAKGTLVGTRSDPAKFFDTPRNLKHLEGLVEHASRLAALVSRLPEAFGNPEAGKEAETEPAPAKEGLFAQGDLRAETRVPPVGPPLENEDELWGPKTAEAPDPTIYPSTRMREIIDVGELPSHLEEQAREMLAKRQKAFSFDGRLGHLDTKTKLVIEEQLKKWFEQGVIEPSKSPWSAPVVIAYRNGKPRFCVDYRKLNAHTIKDEFPIPRQSEILAALSGAQVLSSLDALAGFTQMEFEESEREKTAFRTHQGLFQFVRMPFGLMNGPSIFQRTMQTILAPFLWIFCLVYINDIVVYSKTYEEHIKHLDAVLGACEEAGLTLSPAKCHLFYSSVLLLGHKVSRLGLSTHHEKVRAVLELERPTNRSQLQTFLGMAGYFSAFIPYYAMRASPLFALLKKNTRWHWGDVEGHAFGEIKRALQAAPVLGHPIQGQPYRLYTDASDEALGCALQQVQAIGVLDLKGSKYYERLALAHEKGTDVSRLVTKLNANFDDTNYRDQWAESLNSSQVHVERVIGYWSRTFKPAERNYSATEREALAAKEGLVKFQPFIEGENVALVADHAALQWAHTYENANRRLAAWGAVFSAYKPGWVICHRPGRIHSNVDPLSRLPRDRVTGEIRDAPEHQSPLEDATKPIEPDNADIAAAQEATAANQPRMVFWTEGQPSEPHVASVWATTRAQAKLEKDPPKPERVDFWKKASRASSVPEPALPKKTGDDMPPLDDHWDPHERVTTWQSENPPPALPILIHLSEAKKEEFRKDSWHPAQRFFKDQDGLLFFRDADFQPRLCVPKSLRNEVLRTFHESPFESAHAGFERTLEKMRTVFYWHRMRRDVQTYCLTCDVCQKAKSSNFKQYGLLQPNPVPRRPFECISMDLVTGLTLAEGVNAIWVVVDRLSKIVIFVPTTSGLSTEEFAWLFVKHVACKYGIPDAIITDKDPRWTHDFWRAVARHLKTDMWLSASHHPQHDGQTEVVNKQLEVMLCSFVANNKTDWPQFLPLLEHAHNALPSASTGTSPFFLLYGFQPKDSLIGLKAVDDLCRDPARVKEFLEKIAAVRASARDAIARSQEKQARAYNKGRKEIDLEPGDLVLVDPHGLQWVESKGEAAKLNPKFIGPFPVQERVGPNTYRLDMPDVYTGTNVFNLQHLKIYRGSPEEFGE